jgi:hypothetical protein
VARAVKIIKTHLNTNGVNEDDLKKWVGAEYNLGMVYLRQSLTGTLKRVYLKVRDSTDLAVDIDLGLPFDFKAADHLEAINNNPHA